MALKQLKMILWKIFVWYFLWKNKFETLISNSFARPVEWTWYQWDSNWCKIELTFMFVSNRNQPTKWLQTNHIILALRNVDGDNGPTLIHYDDADFCLRPSNHTEESLQLFLESAQPLHHSLRPGRYPWAWATDGITALLALCDRSVYCLHAR